MTLQLNYTKSHSSAIEPDRFEDGSAGYDLYAVEDKVIKSNALVKIDTGIILEMLGSYYGQICDKSSFVTKKKLKVVAGVIDSSYRGSIIVVLQNLSDEEQHVFIGDKIAQILFLPIMIPRLIYKDDLDMDTTRGDRGFGCVSTI